MVQKSSINQLSIYLRDRIDEYAGKAFPDEFIQEVREIFDFPRYRKMIYRGNEYAGSFKNILRDFRIERLEKEILKK